VNTSIEYGLDSVIEYRSDHTWPECMELALSSDALLAAKGLHCYFRPKTIIASHHVSITHYHQPRVGEPSWCDGRQGPQC
jgi:hypothetical protein